MIRRAAQLLQRCAAFQVADERDVLELAGVSHFSRFSKGQVVFRQGEAASSLYVVESGLLKVSRLSAPGRELTLGLSGPRQLVAGVSVFAEGAVLGAGCLALEDSTVLILPAREVRRVTSQTPALAQAALSYFARRHADLLEQMAALLFTDLNARLAAHLLDQTPPGGCYALPTNSELAALLGIVPELVSRKLGEFYRQGFIGLHRRSVQILDERSLLGLAGRSS